MLYYFITYNPFCLVVVNSHIFVDQSFALKRSDWSEFGESNDEFLSLLCLLFDY